MPVSALELRPRNAVSLFDAALRLCVRSGGVWALTLPGSAAVAAALFHLVTEAGRRGNLGRASLLLAGAWLLRALGQGAACHQVREVLLGTGTPSPTRSLLAALRRAPSLVITTSALLLVHALLVPLSLGLALFFLGSQAVAYAVTMEGRGHPLGFWKQGARQLGPSRGTATLLGWLFAVQGLVLLNLHQGANLLLMLARKLLAVDVTYLERFASLDNGAWLAFLAAATFGLFEPLRAATATLLLVDARVRREGLDLDAALTQLPARAGRAAPAAAPLLLGVLLLGGLLVPAAARAQAPAPLPPAEVVARLRALAEECREEDAEDEEALLSEETQAALLALPPAEQVKLQRFLARLEQDASCEETLPQLESGLSLAVQTAQAPVAGDVAARARDILARPEFQPPPPPPPEEEESAGASAADGLWERLGRWWDAFLEWLSRHDEAPPPRAPTRLPFSGEAAAQSVVVVLLGAVAVLLAVLLLRSRGRAPAEVEAEVTGALREGSLAPPPDSALARPAEGWAGLADQLAAEGRYREALRSLYLALLARLHRDGVISYEPTLSNWDYLRAFRGPAEQRASFRELTARFDFAWYGHASVGAEGYQSFRSLARPLLAPPAPEAAHA